MTCLKQIVTATSFGWSYRGFKKFKSNKHIDNIMVNIQKPTLSMFLCFQRRQHVGFFCILYLSFFLLFPDYCENTLTLTFVFLCWPPTLQSVQLWHLHLSFSRKLDSQLNNLCSVFIYYQSALGKVTTQDQERCSPWNLWQMTLWMI